jgi:nucleotide-binding universal stress UspA family protein
MTILAATDMSDQSRAALRSAARLAARRDQPLEVLYCDEAYAEDAGWRLFVETPWEEPKVRRGEVRKQLDEYLDAVLGDLADALEVTRTVELAHVDDTVAERVDEGDVEWVVVGATGASRVAETLLGSTAEEIVRTSDAPVLVVPSDGELQDIETIVTPTDLSACSRASLEVALGLARDYGADLHVLRAIDVPTTAIVPHEDTPSIDMDGYRDEMQQGLEEFLAEFDLSGVTVSTELPVDTPHEAIVASAAERDADLVVMGTHGRRGIRRLLLGSTTARVLRRIERPVATIRLTE